MQQFNKQHKDFSYEITEEMGEVLYRLKNMMDYYDRNAVVARKKHKSSKCDPVRAKKYKER